MYAELQKQKYASMALHAPTVEKKFAGAPGPSAGAAQKKQMQRVVVPEAQPRMYDESERERGMKKEKSAEKTDKKKGGACCTVM